MSDYAVPVVLSVMMLIVGVIVAMAHVTAQRLKVILLTLRQQLKDQELALSTKLEKRRKRKKDSKKLKEKGKGRERSKSEKTGLAVFLDLETSKSCSEKKTARSVREQTKSSRKSSPEAPSSRNIAGKEMKLFEGDFRGLMKQITPFLQDYHDHPEQHDVCSPNVIPGFLYNALPSHAPEQPCSMVDIWKDYETYVWPGYTRWQHPNFVAYFPCGRSAPDTLAEILISALCVPSDTWHNSRSLMELEVAMVNWLGRTFGLPETMMYHGNAEKSQGGGVLLESASEAILQAVTTARTNKINDILKECGEVAKGEHFHGDLLARTRLERHHEIAGRLVVYASTEAHSSIEKACQMATVALRQLKGDPTQDFAMTGVILEKAIQEDLAAGCIPCMVHVILGSTSSCCFDILDEIGPVAKKCGMWVHADSAYAGSLWADPSLRSSQKGVEYLDSININPHKLLLHSNGMSLLWTTNMAAIRATYGHYEDPKHREQGFDIAEVCMHDTRRQKGLKSWFLFRSLGLEGVRAHVARVVNAARHLHNLMLNHPNVRMFGAPKPALFSWQYVEPGMSPEAVSFHSEQLHRLMNETGRIWITFSEVHGHGIIRISTGFEKVSTEDMDNLWVLMKQCIETYRQRRTDPHLLKFPPPSRPGLHTALSPGLKTAASSMTTFK